MSKMIRGAVLCGALILGGLGVTALFARPQCGGSQFAPCEKVFNACFNEQEFGSYRPLGGVCSDWNDCFVLLASGLPATIWMKGVNHIVGQ